MATRSAATSMSSMPPAAGFQSSTEKPAAPASAPESAAPVAAADANAGATVYSANCATCHGLKGQGDGVAAAGLDPKPANFAAGVFKYDANGNGAPGDIDDIKAIVHDGAATHGGSPLMAPWPSLAPEQLQAVAEYVKSLHGG